MLIDQLIAADHIENATAKAVLGLKTILRAAQKFELGTDFAAAAEELGLNYTSIAKAIPFCRLPYKLMWIEVAQQNRPRFSAAPVHVPTIQSVPTRVGFLLNAHDDQLTRFSAHQFWHLQQWPHPHTASVAMDFDPRRAAEAVPDDSDPRLQRREFFPEIGSSPEWIAADPLTRAQVSMMVQPRIPKFCDIALHSERELQLLYEVGTIDWSGESVFLLACLALLNTLNATASTPVEHRKLNEARAKKKKPPLSDYHVLTIHPRLKRHVEGDVAAHGHRELRAHLVRGHFKVRRTGIYFWRPHARGKGGLVEKSYHVD